MNSREQLGFQFMDIEQGREAKEMLIKVRAELVNDIFKQTGLRVRVSAPDALHAVLSEFLKNRGIK